MPPKHLYFNTGLIDRTLMLFFVSFCIFYVSSYFFFPIIFRNRSAKLSIFCAFVWLLYAFRFEWTNFFFFFVVFFFCMINFFHWYLICVHIYIMKNHFWMSIFHTKNLILFPKRQFAHYSISSCHLANCFYPLWTLLLLLCVFCTWFFFFFSLFRWRKFFFSLPASYTISLCNVSFVFDNWP